jgi:hypothetical protein
VARNGTVTSLPQPAPVIARRVGLALCIAASACGRKANPNMLTNNAGDSVRVSPKPIARASGIPIYGVHEFTSRGVNTYRVVLDCASRRAGPLPASIDSLDVWMVRRFCTY